MEGDDDVLEEDYVFISKGDGESTDDTGQDVEELSGTIEFMVFMDESEETLVYCLSDHFSSWNEFGVQFMKNVLKVISLDGLLGIKKFQELLHELWSHIDLKGSHLNCLVDDKLEEKLINSLEMGPCWIDLVFLLNTGLGELQVRFLNIWEWSENVFFDHGHYIVKMWDD